MTYIRNANTLFLHARKHAKERNIKFKFTKEQWVKWWEQNLGPRWINKRGPRIGQYVMARKMDRGCYELNNVKCVLSSENHKERKLLGHHSHGEIHPRSKLSNAKVIAIRRSSKTNRELADKYGVHIETIRYARLNQTWQHI